ncbi:MAG: hypothetical protein J6N55_02410 [Anaerovibrio sp.]|uniref:hypothetical protein n=1 Tax=Anaerovibrio sp. TaxID=1872532 RepID=UPI001B18A510|nr:hypothetical protein [Anaerovibrio sp.]MBO6245117.1 hypothetical protein [Anaerovibrio sp.]
MASFSYMHDYSLDYNGAKRFAEAMEESNKSSYPSRPDIDMRKELERSEQLLVEHKPEQFRCRG